MIKDLLKTIIISLITLSLIGVAHAWTEPTSNPPTDNVKSPITVSSDTQYKSGLFSTEYLRSYDTTLLATDGGNVGIGTTDPKTKLDISGTVRIDTPTYEPSSSSLIANYPPVKNLGIEGYGKYTGVSGSASDATGYGVQGTGGKAGIYGYSVGEFGGYFAKNPITGAGQGLYAESLCLGTETNCKTDWPSYSYASPTFTGSVTMPGTGIWNSSGNVGIGTTPSSGAKLEVVGDIKIGNQSAACSSANAGSLRYNSNNIELCNGTKWKIVTLAPDAPTVTLTAAANPIATGQSTTLTWAVDDATSSCTASGGGWSGVQTAAGGSITISPTSSTTYTLSCVNAGGTGTNSVAMDVRQWQDTIGSGNLGESCDAWLIRTNQQGVNNSGMRITGGVAGTYSNYCAYADNPSISCWAASPGVQYPGARAYSYCYQGYTQTRR